MHFGEYELSPSLIGLSLLPSAHPKAFQRLPVRPSSWCYPTFSLAKGRSLGFASASADYGALWTRFRFGCASEMLNLAGNGNSFRPLVGAWFQGLFHSSVRGSFHLSFTVLVRYRSPGSI